MIPVLFKIGPLTIYSYGAALVAAFYTTYFLLSRDLKRLNYDDKLASDMIFSAALGGILGAKIYYLMENFGRVLDDPTGMIFSGSGLVFLGGLMGGTLGVTIVLRQNKLPWLIFADIVAPLLILGYAIGRVGCLLVGDDYGLPTHLPWGLTFENGLPATSYANFAENYSWIDLTGFEPGWLKVHPTQLYETLAGLGIFTFLWRKRKNVKITGSLFFTYLVFAGTERFLIEFLRTNEKYLFQMFSGAQVISMIMILIGTYFLFHPFKQDEELGT
ncbi:MAG: prolipoprotein diacylglyceryl transferase [Candidatus Marinimicrobia bacterium]|nr:prolipoprotein diacylglyceryl transferase [Candidatus Neomarinimicrobiota bacterium]MBT7513573.1 prolipoprotein diacylglyceryl transferase [Candidatus Neomarinimicrobiota bacterium]